MTVTKEAVIQLLGDRPVAYHPILARALGGVIEAVFVSQLLYWHGKGKLPDNWIFKTMVEWEEETGLTRRNQQTARRNLINLGIIEYQVRGVPGKGHYRLDVDRLVELFSLHGSDNVQTVQTRKTEPCKLDCTDQPNLIDRTVQSIPETTRDYPETTPERGAAEKTPPAVTPPSHDPTYLPTVEEQLPVLFPHGQEDPDYEQVIQRSGWRINNVDHRRAMALFLEATQLDIPFDKIARKDWLKQVNIHLKTYGLDRLREMYPRIVSEMRADGLSICRPGSLTNPLANMRARDKNGGNHGPNKRPTTQRDPNETFLDPERGLVRRDSSTGELVPVS